MIKNLKITAISENTCLRHELIAQHGQILLLEVDDKKVLFDVGYHASWLLHNLKMMQYSIDTIDSIVLSHRHTDHAGGVDELLPELTTQALFTLPDFGHSDIKTHSEKYRYFAGNTYDLAISSEENAKLEEYKNIRIVHAPTEILTDVWLTGPLGAELEEQSIIINLHEKGVVLVVGCLHQGLTALWQKAVEITGNEKLFGYIGGLHLKEASGEKFDETMKLLDLLQPEFIAPSHCTGVKATQLLQQKFGSRALVSSTGSLGTGNTVQVLPTVEFLAV